PTESLFGLAALGEVPGDLQEPTQLSEFSPDRSDDDARPEAGPVPAKPPALVREPAALARDRQLELRPGPADRLGSVEDRKVVFEDLLPPIYLDPIDTQNV